jgi:hypothetical protein
MKGYFLAFLLEDTRLKKQKKDKIRIIWGKPAEVTCSTQFTNTHLHLSARCEIRILSRGETKIIFFKVKN